MTDENDSTNDVQLLHSNYRNHPGFEKLTDPQLTVQTCTTPLVESGEGFVVSNQVVAMESSSRLIDIF